MTKNITTREYKLYAVKLVEKDKKRTTEVTRELEISQQTLHN
jgi:transposase-like protein